jgi:small-conductance mechanosensitive channel
VTTLHAAEASRKCGVEAPAPAAAVPLPSAPPAEAPASPRLAALHGQVQTLSLEQQYLARHVEAVTETQVTHELALRAQPAATAAACADAAAPLHARLAAAEARAAAAEARAEAAHAALAQQAAALAALTARMDAADAAAQAAAQQQRRLREQLAAQRSEATAAAKRLSDDLALHAAAAEAAVARADAAAAREAALRELVTRTLRAVQSADAQVHANVGTITAQVSTVLRQFVERRFAENNALIDAAMRERVPAYATSASTARFALVRAHAAAPGAHGAAAHAAAHAPGAAEPPVLLVRAEDAQMEQTLETVLRKYAEDGGTQSVAVVPAARGGPRPAADAEAPPK